VFADLVSKRYEWRQIARVLKRNYSLVGSTAAAAAAITGEKYNIIYNINAHYTHTLIYIYIYIYIYNINK
jgi:hypothetical protein